MIIDLTKTAKTFSGGTISCAVAHNLCDPIAALDMAVLQEASKTGAVAAALGLLVAAGGIKINTVKEENNESGKSV